MKHKIKNMLKNEVFWLVLLSSLGMIFSNLTIFENTWIVIILEILLIVLLAIVNVDTPGITDDTRFLVQEVADILKDVLNIVKKSQRNLPKETKDDELESIEQKPPSNEKEVIEIVIPKGDDK